MVIVPYVPGMLHQATAGWAQGRLDACLLRLSGGDDHAYWELLFAQWVMSPSTDLAIVEQDMVPARGVVDSMLACRRPWCTSPYEISNRTVITDGLGCIKLAARLKIRHADLMDVVGAIADDGLPAKNWRRLDTRMSRTLRGLGYRPHVHARSQHLHDYRARP